MEMRKNDADRIAGILSGLKLTGISDKIVRNTLLNDYLALRKIAKELKEEQEELVEKFNQEWSGTKNDDDGYRKALADVTAMLKNLAEEEVDVTVKSVSMDAFMVNVKDELTFEQIAILQDGGLLG